jgi:hypothetical protein
VTVYYSSVNPKGILHEFGHFLGLGHSASMCHPQEAITQETDDICKPEYVTPYTLADGTILQINAVGDYGCVMGYSAGHFFNVAIANLFLNVAEPVLQFNAGDDKAVFNAAAFNRTLPAMELTAQNHIKIARPIPNKEFPNAVRYYFVSYHKAFDRTLGDGFYDLMKTSVARKVHVHMQEMDYMHRVLVEGNYYLYHCPSVLMAVIGEGGSSIIDSYVTVSCASAGTLEARVTVKI